MRETLLERLRQESYFRAIWLTGHDIDPNDAIVTEEANGTNVILPIRSRQPVWDDEGNFVEYRYDNYVWIETSQDAKRGRVIIRPPMHEACFIMFPDWMVMDGRNVSPEVLSGVLDMMYFGGNLSNGQFNFPYGIFHTYTSELQCL